MAITRIRTRAPLQVALLLGVIALASYATTRMRNRTPPAFQARVRAARAVSPRVAPPAGVDPVLGDLLTFHPGWITRLTGSHDPLGGNGDNREAPMEGDYRVLFSARGEGRVTRLWMTADSEKDVPKDYGELWIELDEQTVFRGRPTDFFEGKGPFTAPLVLGQAASSGAFVSYAPLAFHHRARILFRNHPHYFQVSWRQGPGSSEGPTAAETARFLEDAWWKNAPPLTRRARVSPQAPLQVAVGPSLVTAWSLKCAPQDLPRLRLKIADQPSFPASFFFGFGTSTTAPKKSKTAEDIGWPKTHNALTFSDPTSGLLGSRTPIPLSEGQSLVLESETDAEVELGLSQVARPAELAARLHSDYRAQWGPRTKTTFPIFEHGGAVQLFSQVEQIDGGYNGERGFLEGDEMIRFDAMRYPLHLGTGTEDYYDAAFYFQRAFSNPLSGFPRFKAVNAANGWDAATFEYSVYRHHLLDPLVARDGMRFGWESGEDGGYHSAFFRTLVLAYTFDATVAVSHQRFELAGPDPFGRPDDWVYSAVDAEKGQEPFSFPVRAKGATAKLEVRCPSGPKPTGMLLVRDYDASVAGQSAALSINGNALKNAGFFAPSPNPFRRFAQDSVWIDLVPEDCEQGRLSLSVRPEGPWTESAYEAVLWR